MFAQWLGVRWFCIRWAAYLAAMLLCCAAAAVVGFPVDSGLVLACVPLAFIVAFTGWGPGGGDGNGDGDGGG